MTVAQAWCTTTPDAKLAVAVPTGKDAILFNGAKVYGPRLYPFLMTNWQFIWPTEGLLFDRKLYYDKGVSSQTGREQILMLVCLVLTGHLNLSLFFRRQKMNIDFEYQNLPGKRGLHTVHRVVK